MKTKNVARAKKTTKSTKALKRIEYTIPGELYQQMEVLVQGGWFKTRDDVLNLALKRFLDTHRPEVMEKHILEDVEWGLRGGN